MSGTDGLGPGTDVGLPTPGPAEWRATYRFQLTAAFTFDDAAAFVDHLATLGISHLYLSPVFESVAGSTHGYDGTDPTRISEERGGETALRALAVRAHAAGLGILVDLVPNHLAASDQTPWWADEAERPKVFDYDAETGWYRRFFDIDGLAGVRQEDPEVFQRTHAKVLELVRDGVVDGLRIDHPDGLTDPAGYLRQLHEAAGVPIWVEKILHPGEELRPWPVAGTVGYEFADDATAVFVDPDGEERFTALYGELARDQQAFDDVALTAKREKLHGPFARELDRLADLAPDVDRSDLAEAIVRFPIYRTYVDPITGTVTDEDRAAVAASGAPPDLAARLLLDDRGDGGHQHDELVQRFQQTTAPITAKGVEDTAFYRSLRLLARNEVGCDPTTFSLPVDGFHAACRRRERWPLGLLAATTHDTKRSADTRARLGTLPGLVDELELHVRRWFALGEEVAPHGTGPTPGERWLLFQTLLGSWPITEERLDDYLVKALREAGLSTQWVDPDEAHEASVLAFYRRLLALPAFAADFAPFAERVARAGEWASVGQTLLRATTPGVCDVYHGDESWFLSVVDPDNRRPLDPERLRSQLERVRSGAEPTRETAKTHVLHHALTLRANRPAPFAGPYLPLEAGRATIAYTRGDDAEVLVVVPVRPDPAARLAGLVPGRWRDALHGAERDLPAEVSVAELVGPLGVACWERLD